MNKQVAFVSIVLVALAIAVGFLSASRPPDPRREAEAFATRSQAEAESARATQGLQQNAEEHRMKMERLNEVSQWISTVMMTSMIASMFVIVVAGISFGVGLTFVFIAGGVGTAKRQLMKPYHEQIKLDPVTRQYPLIITKVDEGKYSLTNPNVGSVTMLYDRNPADRMMIQAMSATQHDGALAYQARLSHKPGEIAQIEAPQILEVS